MGKVQKSGIDKELQDQAGHAQAGQLGRRARHLPVTVFA
jgi:hypothetical protein